MKTKVLLVDDDSSVVAPLTGVLRTEGYDVIQAFDGHAALETFHTVGGTYIVLLDRMFRLLAIRKNSPPT